MPEKDSTLFELLDLDLLTQYEEEEGSDPERLFIYGTIDELERFVPDERAEILWDDHATRLETEQPTYGLQELCSVSEAIEILEAFDNDPEEALIFLTEEENPDDEDIE